MHITFGKFKGKELDELMTMEQHYIWWIMETFDDDWIELKDAIVAHPKWADIKKRYEKPKKTKAKPKKASVIQEVEYTSLGDLCDQLFNT